MVRMIHSFRSFHSLTTRSVALSVRPAASLAPHGGMGGIGHLWGIRTVQLVRQVCSFQSFHSVRSFCSFTRFTWRDGRDWHFLGPRRIRTAWSVRMVRSFQSFHSLIAHFFTLSVCFCSFTFSTQKEGRDWAFQALINLGRFGLSATSTPGGVAHCARMPRSLGVVLCFFSVYSLNFVADYVPSLGTATSATCP